MDDIRRGEIFYIARGGATNGSEQFADRPAVVVSNDENNKHSGVIEVVYMTTQPKTDLPTHVTIRSTGRISTVLCEQVSSVSTERVNNYIGQVSEQEMKNIDIALMISLQLDNGGKSSKQYNETIQRQQEEIDSLKIVIPYMVDGVKKYFVHTHSFIPASRVDEHIKTDKVPYDVWISKGLVTVTETLGGIKTDYKYIIKYLEDLIKQNDLKPQLVCYDPHNASAFLSDLEALGFDSVAITQTAKELNDATVDFRLEIKAGNVVIEGTEVGKGKVVPFDELLTWSIANAKTISNSYGEIKIDKALDEDRIDPIDAIIDAWKAAMKEEYKPDTNEVVNEWLEMYEKYMGKGGEKE